MNRIILFSLLIVSFSLSGQNIEELLKNENPAEGFKPFLKIGIKVDTDSFPLEGDAEIFTKNGKNAGSIQGKYTVSVSKGKISVSGRTFNSEMIKLTPKFMLIKIGQRMFRGEIEIWLRNGKLTVINDLNIEDYVRGVINKEAIPSWPLEAKKTQAVLARTFAVYQKMFNPRNELFDLAPSVLDQVYDGLDKEDVTSNKAVDETRGEVITKGHHPVKIYFHSTCGGMTSSSSEIWKKDEPHLKSVKCPYCKKSSLYRWKRSVSSKVLSDKLGVGKVKSIQVVRSETRVESLIVDNKMIPVNKFRELVGFSVIWSNDFTVSKSGSNFIFEGKGAGHGVGVCQWGMAGMAAEGKAHKEIINFYLTGIEIRKMY
ncbi:MAG TPA: SpoIID/LytB domain-containing protein [bacterium]|nr:SpoIID/LytB domain-containing protein [bacterium]HQM83619.1 SpoIID/LytB domain-containing protein [bacterium]